jgi:hypothetical protein
MSDFIIILYQKMVMAKMELKVVDIAFCGRCGAEPKVRAGTGRKTL